MNLFILEHISQIILVIIILPLVSFFSQLLFGNRFPRNGDWLSIGLIFCSFCLSVLLFVFFLDIFNPNFRCNLSLPWINFGNIHIDFTIFLNFQSVIMLVVVTLVSFIIQLASMRYKDKCFHYANRHAYMSLLVFSVLCIIVTNHLLFLFFFMELLSVSLYYLMGYCSENELSHLESVRMFIMNQIGDSGILIGSIILFSQLGEFTIPDVLTALDQGKLTSDWLTISGICLFCGVIGKAALFPLYVWLNGISLKPITGSALIFSVGNIASGILFLLKIYPILPMPVLQTLSYIGIITSIIGSIGALIQTDLKKILAYSSISSTGLMCIGLGMRIHTPVFLYLVIHILGISCLFLCADSIIHQLHSGEIQEMRGLRKKMPLTFFIFLFAVITVSGFPLTAGFISKNAYIYDVFQLARGNNQYLIHAIFCFTGLGLTSFYLFRLMIIVFLKNPLPEDKHAHVHESPYYITIPLIFLCCLLTYTVYTIPSLNPLYFDNGWFSKMLQNPSSVIPPVHSYPQQPIINRSPEYYSVLGIYFFIISAGTLLAYMVYYWELISTERLVEKFRILYRLIETGFFLNELYDRVIVKLIMFIGRVLYWFDKNVFNGIDYLVKKCTLLLSGFLQYFDSIIINTAILTIAHCIAWSGKAISFTQTGRLQNYLIIVLSGILIIMIFLLTN